MIFYSQNFYLCSMLDYDSIYRSFVKGDIEPFYTVLYPGLLVYATRQLGEELSYLAEDCVQDAVVTSYDERRRFDSSMAWYRFILKCIFHSALMLVRKNRSRLNYLSSGRSGEDSEPDVDVEMLEQETLDMLYSAIQSLPERHRDILRMSYHEGLKNSEIAERLGVAEITVKKQKAQMLAMLRSRLGDFYSIFAIGIMLKNMYF